MNCYYYFLRLLVFCSCLGTTAIASIPREMKVRQYLQRDTVLNDSIPEQDVVVYYNVDPTKPYLGRDSLQMHRIRNIPQVTLVQYLKGQLAGLYNQETSAEPGTVQQANFIRGLSVPILSANDQIKSRPLIVVDGIPLIDDHPMVYAIQDYYIQPLGAASSLQSILELDNIASIQLLKDYSTAGIYGPRAAHGVISITTKNARPGNRMLSVNLYSGFAEPTSVTSINADYEKRFRRPFYDLYATPQQAAAYPAYLSDSSNINYYGPSNWTDLYYKLTPLLAANGSLSGGGERSNFRVFAAHTKQVAAADDTDLKRYQGAFYLNMQPNKWMTISSMLHMTRLHRNRNRSLQERFAEYRYFPDMSTPLAPNKAMYGLFLQEHEKAFDKNINNSMLGKIVIHFELAKNLSFSPRFSIDYNENKRALFWPTTILNGNNYVSDYFGYNERISFDNILRYDYQLADKSKLLAEMGLNYQADAHRYNYASGYKGPNDFIKVNIVEGNSKLSNYLRATGFIPYYYSDFLEQRLISMYGRLSYTQAGQYRLSAMLRRDGSSLVQPNSRWFNAFNIDADYNLNQHLGMDWLDHLNVFASYGRMGIVPDSDREAAGPHYNSALGWEGNTAVFSYNGFGTINRPYYLGWVGYNIPWSYNNLSNLGLDLSIGKKYKLRAEYYARHMKDASLTIPTVAESGYRYVLSSGMAVRNSGIDLSLDAQFIVPGQRKLGWNSSFHIAYNVNKLTALPDGLQEVVIGDRKLQVGKRIDHFWLLKNEGIFKEDIEVPVNPVDYKILTYKDGPAFKAGDPRWLDVNKDYNIDDNDRQLMGNSMPKYIGGLYNQLTYGALAFSFQLYFQLDRWIINKNAAKFYDFANRDEASALDAVRDISFWEKNFDDQRYPLFNPWSAVSPYQAEQDMFLEDASFLKLRNLSIGYDFTSLVNRGRPTFSKCYTYISGTNLFSFTKYSGRDPELADFKGYDTGLGLRYPRIFTLGIKLDF